MSGSMRKLAGQTVVYGVSTVLVKMLSYIQTPYLTRVMGGGTYGMFTQLYAIIPFLLVLLTMGMESGYFRFAGKAESEEDKRRVFATTWGAVSLATAVFVLLVVLFRGPLTTFFEFGDHPSYILLMGGVVALDAWAAIPFARLREQGRAMRYVALRLLSVTVTLALCFFFYSGLPALAARGVLASWYDPEFGAGYQLVANLLASALTMILILPSCDRVRPRIDRKLAKSIFLYSMPLLVSGIAGTANEFIDRQMILWIMPGDIEEVRAELGVYGALLKLGVVMTLFTSMYRLAAEPFFLAEFKGDDFRRSNAESMKYFLIVSVFIFLLITLFSDVFALILGSRFRGGVWLLPVVLLSNMFSGFVLNMSFWYKQTGATRYAIIVTGTGLLFTVAFNIMLVPSLGYVGAAFARLACEGAMVVVSYYLNRKHYPVPYDLRRMGGYLLLGAVLYGAGTLCGGLAPWARYLINSGLVIIFAWYAVWRERIDLAGLFRSLAGALRR